MSGSALIAAFVVAVAAAAVPSEATAATLFGTNGPDRLLATPEADVIYAKSGNDTIIDVGSGDTVYAASGNDTISTLPFGRVSGVYIDGNAGNDAIRSTTGKLDAAKINGGSGDDLVSIKGCGNHVLGGGGNDRYENLEICPNPDSGTIDMGNGIDSVNVLFAARIAGGNGDDTLRTRFPGTLLAGSGNDIVRFDLGGFASVDLGAGNDSLNLSSAKSTTVLGGSGQDHVFGRPSDSAIATHSGHDLIELEHHATGNSLDGGGNRDVARLGGANAGTTCRAIERVLGADGSPRGC